MCRKPGIETCQEVLEILASDQTDSKPENLVPHIAVYLELKMKQVTI